MWFGTREKPAIDVFKVPVLRDHLTPQKEANETQAKYVCLMC